jgi:hypothetical protein
VESTPEIILVSAIAWCFLVTGVAYKMLELSPAIGALVAGAGLSTFPYRLDVAGKLRSIRDFFVLLFFVTLGLQIAAPTRQILVNSLWLSAVVVASRVLTVVPVAAMLRIGARPGWVSSFALAQVSEFALVLGLIGIGLGHVDEAVLSTIAFSLAVTTALSSYLVAFSHRIVGWMQRLVRTPLSAEDTGVMAAGSPRVLVLGFHRIASGLAARLDREFLVVDFNPTVVRALRERGVRAVVGDLSNPAVLEQLPLAGARAVLVTIPDDFLRATSPAEVVARVRKRAPAVPIVAASDNLTRARVIYEAGADYVVLPRWAAADAFEEALRWISEGKLQEARRAQQERLARDEEVVP